MNKVQSRSPAIPHRLRLRVVAPFLLGASLLFTGCETVPAGTPISANDAQATDSLPDVLVLSEGDQVRITFPGAPNLDTTQQVRTDGRVTLAMVGEVVAAGMTPAQLEKKLLELYDAELVSKEVSVTVVSSQFTVFVTGAIRNPGKIVSNRPLSALEAVMEAGGFDTTRADMEAVRVVRLKDGVTQNYVVNLKQALEGGQTQPFYLKRSDIVYVPEKFSWF